MFDLLEISEFRKFRKSSNPPVVIMMIGQKKRPKSNDVSSSIRKREPVMIRITPQKIFRKFMTKNLNMRLRIVLQQENVFP